MYVLSRTVVEGVGRVWFVSAPAIDLEKVESHDKHGVEDECSEDGVHHQHHERGETLGAQKTEPSRRSTESREEVDSIKHGRRLNARAYHLDESGVITQAGIKKKCIAVTTSTSGGAQRESVMGNEYGARTLA